MKRALSVWWDRVVAGELWLDDNGDMSFVYAADWLADTARLALSISLPKREAPFGRRPCHSFFSGLLPEGDVREAAARNRGLSKENDFGLLEALGGDVAGALSFLPAGERPPSYDAQRTPVPLSDDVLSARIDELPKRPFLAGEDGLRLSLAGAQPKLPVVLVDGRVALPLPGQPTTHILKPPMARFPATTENEAFVMRLGAEAGLGVAPVEPRKLGNRSYLLVSRYDRAIDAAGHVRRLHQEDFCQALGIPPEHKYAAEGGPTFKTSFGLLQSAATRPAIEVLRLLDAAIFNLIVGNADAHGKNFSLLYRDDGTVLAPLYDLMCTAAYPEIAAKSAMKMGGASKIEEIAPKTWKSFAEDTKLGRPLVDRRARELTEKIHSLAEGTARKIAHDGFAERELERFAAIVRERAEIVGASV